MVGAAFSATTLALYCMVVASTVLHWWRSGSLFVAPCLTELKSARGKEAPGGAGGSEGAALKEGLAYPPDLGLLMEEDGGAEDGLNGSSDSGGEPGGGHAHGA